MNATFNDAANWDNGLPISIGKIGNFNSNRTRLDEAVIGAVDGLFVIQDGGIIRNFDKATTLSNGEWTNQGSEFNLGSKNLTLINQTFTMNGGTLTGGSIVAQGTSVINFNGGTSSLSSMSFQDSAYYAFGGTTAGTATFSGNFAGTGTIDLRWTTGSLMALTITGADEWAAA